MEIRWSRPDEPLLKTYVEPRPCFRNAVEFNSVADLDNVANDLDQMRVQSLLICERILGPHHKDTLFRIMYRGAAYADALRYQRCIDLWRRALEIRVEKDTVRLKSAFYYHNTCFYSSHKRFDIMRHNDFYRTSLSFFFYNSCFYTSHKQFETNTSAVIFTAHAPDSF